MNVGDKAPEVLGVNEKGERILLSNYRGKKLKSVYVHFVMMKRLISYLRQEVQGFLCVIVLLRLQWQLHIGMFRGSQRR